MGPPLVLVIERDIAGDHRDFEDPAGVRDPPDALPKLPADFGILPGSRNSGNPSAPRAPLRHRQDSAPPRPPPGRRLGEDPDSSTRD